MNNKSIPITVKFIASQSIAEEQNMKKQLETLKKIQDLSLTRAECTARGENAPVESLTKEISALAETLEQRVLALYTRLSATRPLFLSAMHNGKCSGCGMQVPVASAKMVRMNCFVNSVMRTTATVWIKYYCCPLSGQQ